ncbi:MAG: hypothetical protein J6K69_04330 [Candidatus Methanomethylophilaceae archaeon]|nr:hypothetical protein [Candidatus Methanomethylophilaceae archaeon]MBQ8643597.1 hypothetical protein [Candidatus Methanomethylophilaceae archaeon]MBR2347610.1 hypothetical protein [Candidatus Methanomethylophilaceae archaeon]
MDYGLPKYQEIEENVKIPLMEVDLAFGPEDGPIIVGRNDFDSFNKLIDTIGAKMAFVQYDWILPPGMCVDMEEYDIDELFGEDDAEAIKAIVQERNDLLNALGDDLLQYRACVFVMHEGQAFGIERYIDGFEEDFLMEPEEFLTELLFMTEAEE